MPIPKETPKELNPSLRRLTEVCDLLAYRTFVAHRTRHGLRPGPAPWTYTEQFMRRHSQCEPEEAIALFKEAGADNDQEALFHVAVAVSANLIP